MTPEVQKLVRANLGAFFLKANEPDYAWVAFQQDFIVPALHRIAKHECKALMIWMPPRHAKTDLALLHFLAWLFGRFPKRSNMALSYSDKFAKRFGRKILNIVRSDVYKEAFPEEMCRVSPTARSGSYFVMNGGGQFFSAGFSGTITGQGVDGVLAIDDPIKNMEEAKSEVVMRSRMEDYRSSAKTRLEGGSRLLTTTRWSKNDFAQRVLDEDGYEHEGGDWTVLSFPAEAGVDDPLERAPGEFLWPERFGPAHYLSAKRNTRTWNALFQQAPDAEKGRFFKNEWLTWYENPVKPGRFPAYMIVDPARGQTDGHDRTCILVFVSTPEKRLLLVDAVLGRLDPGQRAAEMVRLHRKWRPHRTVYEEYGLVNDTWYLEQEYRKRGIRAYPQAVGRKGARHQLTKESRIEGLIPDFREGRICLPRPDKIQFPHVQSDDNVDYNAESISIIEYFIDHEYLPYCGEDSVPFDDMLDAMTRLHDPELSISFPRNAAQDVARSIERNRPRYGSWESVL